MLDFLQRLSSNWRQQIRLESTWEAWTFLLNILLQYPSLKAKQSLHEFKILLKQQINGNSNIPNNLPIQQKGAALIYGVLTMFISAVQTLSKRIMKNVSLYFPEIACLMIAQSYKAYRPTIPFYTFIHLQNGLDFLESFDWQIFINPDVVVICIWPFQTQ